MNKLKKHGIYYDSRIKLLLILLTSALAFALGGGLTGLLLFGVVCLFALLSGLWKTSIKFAIVYIVLLVQNVTLIGFLLSHLYCYNPYLGHMYEDFRPHLHSPPQ